MDYAHLEVRLTDHAYAAYCDRVEEIDRSELADQLQHRIRGRSFYKKNQYMQISGVWWIAELQDNLLILVTCYGRSDIDMPKAMKWAANHHDRINLDDLPDSRRHDA